MKWENNNFFTVSSQKMLWPMTAFCSGKVEPWWQNMSICASILLTHGKDGTGEEKIGHSWYLIHFFPASADVFFSLSSLSPSALLHSVPGPTYMVPIFILSSFISLFIKNTMYLAWGHRVWGSMKVRCSERQESSAVLEELYFSGTCLGSLVA